MHNAPSFSAEQKKYNQPISPYAKAHQHEGGDHPTSATQANTTSGFG